jgi:hypothetical protein
MTHPAAAAGGKDAAAVDLIAMPPRQAARALLMRA